MCQSVNALGADSQANGAAPSGSGRWISFDKSQRVDESVVTEAALRSERGNRARPVMMNPWI